MKEYQVTIIKQDHFGDGIAKINDRLTFVEKGLKEEVVKVIVEKENKKYLRAKITEIISPSKERVKPPCPYYQFCGGCNLEHQSYEASLLWKEEKVRELLEKYASYTGKIEKIKASPAYHYRNKVKLKVCRQTLSLMKEKTNEKIPINACLLLPDQMNELIKAINQYLKEAKAFNEVQLRMNKKEVFQIAIEGSVEREKLLKHLKNIHVESIYQNGKLIFGTKDFQDDIFKTPFYLSPRAFFQVNRLQIETLYGLVLDAVKENLPKKLLDLYCGVGTLGILASSYVSEVVGIEVVEEAIIEANRNKKRNKVTNITFYQAKVEEKIKDLKDYDFWIVDPPRKGLDSKTKQAMLSDLPKTVCYVSCDPVTLARDLKELSCFYQIKKVTPVDMFPETYHVECVCVLCLR